MAAKKVSSNYDASSITVLEGLDAVRKRPGMYVGSTDSRGLQHCLWEIIDNAVDEAIAGHCRTIGVTLHSDGSLSVEDDGRGIPVDVDPRTNLTGVELVFTKLHAGGKFGDGGGYTVSGGLHGVGASVVNALSTRLDVTVRRGGSEHHLSFHRGEPGQFDAKDQFTRKAGLVTGRKIPAATTGTRVQYWPDWEIFLPGSSIDWDATVARARQTAFLVPGVTICVRDERSTDVVEETFRFDGGIRDFVEFRATGNPLTDALVLHGSGEFTERVPVLRDGRSSLEDVKRDVEVEVGVQWSSGYESDVVSFVNIISTPKGGTHVAGFERALVKTVNDQLRAARILKSSEENVTKDDCQEGMTCVVTVRLAEPQFEGQTKEVLGTRDVGPIVSRVVSDGLTAFFTGKKSRVAARAVLEKIAQAARARVAAREVRETKRRKTALESSSMPAKLVDCRSEDVAQAELFIVEGDSALGTFKAGRDSNFQAALPIRGKILNTLRASEKQMLANTECAALIQVMGAGSGKSFDLEAARYGKLVFLTDADVDGAHIRCLLLTLVFRYMRPLLDAGRVYSAVPPLHQVKVGSGRTEEVFYTYSDGELKELLDRLRKSGKTLREDAVQRYKGLGEMDADQLAETTLDPSKRRLRRIQVDEAEQALRLFEVLMGDDVAVRREYIFANSTLLDPSLIDA